MQYVTVAVQDRGGEVDLMTLPVKDLTPANVQAFVDDLQQLCENTIIGVTVFLSRNLVKNTTRSAVARNNEIDNEQGEYPQGRTGTIRVITNQGGEDLEFFAPFNLKGTRGEVELLEPTLTQFLKDFAALGDGLPVTNVEYLRKYSDAGYTLT